MTISTASRTTIVPIDRAYDHPDELLRLVQASGPYWNQSRYIPNGAKLGPGHPLVAPDGPPGFPATAVFRADWFRRTDSTPDGRRLAFHEPFLTAARVVHGGEHVVPFLVHVNLNAPGPSSDAGHLDVPAFRGLDLRTAPGWLLLGLARAGLAGRWRLRVATAISWLYRGEGGGFTCWPDGPQGHAGDDHRPLEPGRGARRRHGAPSRRVGRSARHPRRCGHAAVVDHGRRGPLGRRRRGPADVVRARRCPRERLVEGRGLHIGARARTCTSTDAIRSRSSTRPSCSPPRFAAAVATSRRAWRSTTFVSPTRWRGRSPRHGRSSVTRRVPQ